MPNLRDVKQKVCCDRHVWEEYLVVLPSGDPVRGYLDPEGFARIDPVPSPGICKVSFPRLDKEATELIEILSEKRRS